MIGELSNSRYLTPHLPDRFFGAELRPAGVRPLFASGKEDPRIRKRRVALGGGGGEGIEALKHWRKKNERGLTHSSSRSLGGRDWVIR